MNNDEKYKEVLKTIVLAVLFFNAIIFLEGLFGNEFLAHPVNSRLPAYRTCNIILFS